MVRVELFEDRVAVTRRLQLDGPGRHRVRIGPLSPLVRAEAVSFPGGVAAVVEEVRAVRQRQSRVDADPDALIDLHARARAAGARAAVASDTQARANAAVQRAEAGLAAARKATGRALQAAVDPAPWVAGIAALVDSLRVASGARAAAEAASEAAGAEAQRLQSSLEAAREGRPVLQGFLDVSLVAEEAGEWLLRYVLPCAVWRPAHRAELTQDGRTGTVRWELRAVCWNATGEDWRGVQLVCSTARPGDRAAPPPLGEDVLAVTARETAIEVEARDEEVRLVQPGGSRTDQGAAGVDDGGEVRTYTAAETVDLPSTGAPVTVPLDAWESSATLRWQAQPERDAAVFLRSRQANAGDRPILAGPVRLVRDGESIGRGVVQLVAPGAAFDLGWGAHDGVRVRRTARRDVDVTRITGRQHHRFEVALQVQHAGEVPCRVEVVERVPVSELSAVRVSAPDATPAPEQVDDDGLVRWTLELAPGDERQLALTYVVDAGSTVVLPFGSG